MNFDHYEIIEDIFKHRTHIFYLMGYVRDENASYAIASYSIKTKKLIIKNAMTHIPQSETLKDFVRIANNKFKGE